MGTNMSRSTRKTPIDKTDSWRHRLYINGRWIRPERSKTRDIIASRHQDCLDDYDFPQHVKIKRCFKYYFGYMKHEKEQFIVDSWHLGESSYRYKPSILLERYKKRMRK